VVAAFVCSFLLAGVYRQIVLRKLLLDIQNFVIPDCALAVLSYLDDLGPVKPQWYLVVQLSAACICVYRLGAAPNAIADHLSLALQACFLLVAISAAVLLGCA